MPDITAPDPDSNPPLLPERIPARHGLPWSEDDFTALMHACRSDATLEEVAERVGRTLHSVRPQLRRLLPLDERHLPSDLVLARLRQLDRDGDYDWLAALAQRSRSAWEVQAEAQAAQDARGVGALTDEEVVHLSLALATCTASVPRETRRAFARELQRRDLAGHIVDQAASTARDAARSLLGLDPAGWAFDGSYPAPDWRP